jgi:hypothetical protein
VVLVVVLQTVVWCLWRVCLVEGWLRLTDAVAGTVCCSRSTMTVIERRMAMLEVPTGLPDGRVRLATAELAL